MHVGRLAAHARRDQLVDQRGDAAARRRVVALLELGDGLLDQRLEAAVVDLALAPAPRVGAVEIARDLALARLGSLHEQVGGHLELVDRDDVGRVRHRHRERPLGDVGAQRRDAVLARERLGDQRDRDGVGLDRIEAQVLDAGLIRERMRYRLFARETEIYQDLSELSARPLLLGQRDRDLTLVDDAGLDQDLAHPALARRAAFAALAGWIAAHEERLDLGRGELDRLHEQLRLELERVDRQEVARIRHRHEQQAVVFAQLERHRLVSPGQLAADARQRLRLGLDPCCVAALLAKLVGERFTDRGRRGEAERDQKLAELASGALLLDERSLDLLVRDDARFDEERSQLLASHGIPPERPAALSARYIGARARKVEQEARTSPERARALRSIPPAPGPMRWPDGRRSGMERRARRWRGRVAPALIALSSWALLSYSALPQSSRADEREKIAQTTASLKRLTSALFGSANGVGYIGDMGGLPASLEDLSATGGNPAYSTNHQGSVGMGFNGPYLTRAGAASSAFVDAWNSPLALVAANGEVRIRSAGPDRDPASDADNVYYPLSPRTTHGTIEAIVTSVPASGGNPTPLDDTAVEVRVYYAAAGAEASALATYTGANGAFQLQNVHVGRHYVSVTARVPQDFDVSSGADTLALRGKKASARFQLVSRSTVTLCHQPGGGAGQTLSLPSSAADAHLGHGDALGPCGAGAPEAEGEEETPPPADDPDEGKKKKKK